MYKTTIKETTEKFDKDGKLIERTIREETTEDYEDNTIATTNSKWHPSNHITMYRSEDTSVENSSDSFARSVSKCLDTK